MNFPNNQPISTFIPQRPPPAIPTDCLFTYTRINSLCKPIDRIADSIDPFELANNPCLLYTSPSPRDGLLSRMPSSA